MDQQEEYRYGYPDLSEEGQKKTQEIVNAFAEKLKSVFNDTLYEFTKNIGSEIVNDDSWIDVRMKTLDALKGYPIEGQFKSYDWIAIRAKILEENREAIINDIILDKENEIRVLKESIESMRKFY